MIRQGSIGQGVQFTSLHILLQLLVPRGRIKGGKPLPELGQLLSRQTTDLLFKLLDLGHNQEYKGSLIVRLTQYWVANHPQSSRSSQPKTPRRTLQESRLPRCVPTTTTLTCWNLA